MKRTLRYYRLIWLRNDFNAGLSVFLVALPLCLGIALASGAPLYAGLLSGVVGGLLVTPLSGSPLSVSGPAAGLTPVVAAAIISMGDYRVFLLSVCIAGLFQIILGVLKLGTIANYFPSSVIKGMLAAIGIILLSKQIPIALGYDRPDFWSGGFREIVTEHHVVHYIRNLGHHLSPGAILITFISLLIMVFDQKLLPAPLNILPASLWVVAAGIAYSFFFSDPGHFLSLQNNQKVQIPPDVFHQLQFPAFDQLFTMRSIWQNGLLIGLLASLETLLCIEAIDKLDRRNRITPVNRELVAQGAGNLVCGLCGGLPVTAVVVRGAANVDAGAKTKLSAFTHSLFLLCAVLFIPFLLNRIPYASLAAILMVTGYNLTRPKLYRNVWSLGLKQFLPFMITLIVILATDLLIGVSIGLIVSVYYIVRNNYKAEYKLLPGKDQPDSYILLLNTNVTFLNKVNLRKVLDEIPAGSCLLIDGRHCNFIDYDILEVISEFERKADERQIKLQLEGITRVNVTAVH